MTVRPDAHRLPLRDSDAWPTAAEIEHASSTLFVSGTSAEDILRARTWSCFRDPLDCPGDHFDLMSLRDGPSFEWNPAGTLLRCTWCGMDGT